MSKKPTYEELEQRVLELEKVDSERKQAVEDLRESEKRLSSIYNAIGDTIFVLDVEADGDYVFSSANPAFLSATGLPVESVVGKNVKEVIPISSLDLVLSNYRQAIQKKTIVRWEETSEYPTGKRTALVTIAPILATDGTCQQLVGSVKDITERKITEEALRLSEEKHRRIFENIPTSIILIDKAGKIEDINPFHINEIGKGLTTKDDYVGQNVMEMGPPKNAGISEKIKRVLEGKSLDLKEVQYPTTTGGTVGFFNVKGEPILGPNAEVIGAVIIHEDITDRILAEKEKEGLEEQLRQTHKMEAIGTLSGGIAHDFNNLLLGILGRTSLMLTDANVDSKHIEHLKGIEQYVKSATDLTQQLLGFSRGGKYEVKPINMNDLIKNQNNMFGRMKKEITIREKYSKDLWSTEVDSGQIEQVLLNLYVNAWQAMPGGGDLYTQTENVIMDESPIKPFHINPGKYVKISITDTGIGMDQTTRERIFDPFFTTKDMVRGTGLGLASVYGIIKNHGGFIKVYSEKGEGTTFDIYLPASEKDPIKEIKSSEDLVMGDATILLVDDEELVIDVSGMLLKRLGFTLLTASSGKEAIEMYQKNKNNIDMVILDMIMPGIGGGETYDQLKEINPDIKVILSSGYSINGQATEILNRGCNGFIQKPFNIESLSQKVREVLNKK